MSGASTALAAQVVQWPFSGKANAQWTFEPSGGYYHIKNVNSGLVLNVASSSGQKGANFVQWSAQGLTPGNDPWRPVQNPDGLIR